MPVKFGCALHSHTVAVLSDLLKFLPEDAEARLVVPRACAPGPDQTAVYVDHPADEIHRVFASLDFERVNSQVHVLPELFPGYNERDIGISADTLVDGLDLFGLFPSLTKDLSPLLIRQHTQPKAASRAVGPSFEFDDFVAIFIPAAALNIGIADQLVKRAVPYPAHAAVAVDQDFRGHSEGVCGAFETGELFDGLDLGACYYLGSAVAGILG